MGRFARGFALAFLFLLILTASALAIFVVTFQADRYRPLIQQKLQESLGMPVEMEKISLGWEEGLALKIDNLTLFQASPARAQFLRLHSAAVKISPAPLLRHELQVSSVIIEDPEIKLTRSPSGKILELSAAPSTEQVPGTAQAAKPASAPASAALSFFVDLIKIKNGTVHFIDQSPASPADIRIENIDISVRDISLTKPLTLDARAAVFSGKQNISVDGKLRLVPQENGLVIQDLTGRLDLAQVDAGRLLRSFPSLQQVGLAQGMTGQLEAKVSRLKTAAGKVVELDAEMHVIQASVKTAAMPLPLENFSADMTFSPERVILQNFSGNFGRGRIEAAAKMENTLPPQLQLQASAAGLDFSDFVPPAKEGAPYMSGKISGELKAGAQGSNGVLIQRTLTGNGVVDLQNLVLVNMNVLREILKNLARVPAIGQSLENRLPPEYRQKLEANDTAFAPVQIPILIQQGSLFFDHVVVQSDTFSVIASGRLGLAGSVQMTAVVTLDPQLSYALIGGINELQYLADAQGQLQIPLVQAPGPKFALIPDIPYIASKLAVGKGREVLTNILQKKDGTAQGTQTGFGQTSGYNQQGYGNQGYTDPGYGQQQTGTTDYRKMKGKDLLSQFLQTAIQPQNSSDSSNQQY